MKKFEVLTFMLFTVSFLTLLTGCGQSQSPFQSQSQKQTSHNITFELHSPALKPNAEIYITGSSLVLGNWQPDLVPLSYISEDIWQITLPFNFNESFEYKFTQGDWSVEIADKNGSVLPNFVGLADKDKTIVIKAEQWTSKSQNTLSGQITGTVEYHQHFSSEDILERDIIVWLPPGYNKDMQQSYPVLYMHDGQNIIDPATSSFGVDWQMDETSTDMMNNNEMEKIIIVGINNSKDRSTELDPTLKQGQQYMDFVINIIKPFIDSNYRTKPKAEYTAVGGSSMGGIMSFAMVWQYPQIFSKAIVMSPALKVDHIDYVSVVQNSNIPSTPVYFYIDNGGIGLEQKLQPGIDEMLQVLTKQHKFEQFTWVQDVDGRHSEADWAKRLPQAFKILFPKVTDNKNN